MSARPGQRWVFAFLLTLAVALHAPLAQAQAPAPVPTDSLLHDYVRSMSDSTDAWYGATAAPVDTAGLDSALSVGLARPHGARGSAGNNSGHGNFDMGLSPALGFNRADGAQLGVGLSPRSPFPGRLSGRVQYTTGTQDYLGEGTWRDSWQVERLGSRVSFRIAAGRYTESFNRDHYYPVLTTAAAVLYGGDRHMYLRRDGFSSLLRLGNDRQFASIGWRDQLESSLPYTTSWTLFGPGPVLAFNSAAEFGRAHELSLEGDVTIPGTRFRVNAAHWTSDPRMGSDFRYHRTRWTAAGDVSLGGHLALVPQVTYGRLHGTALPQEVFFLGGVDNLRTLEREELQGSGQTFARVELILVDDLGKLLHLPLPAFLPLQSRVFAASGSVWGRDIVTGAAVPTLRDWPHASEWLSEVGAGLSWRPGIPDPLAALLFEYAVPIGPDLREARFTVAFRRTLNLLPKL